MKERTADRLSEIMRERNLKQVYILNFAKPYCEKYKVKLSKSDLSQYVSGKVEPGQTKIFVLAHALNVNEAWLMGADVPSQRDLPDTLKENIDGEVFVSSAKQALHKFVDEITDEEAVRALRVLKAALTEEGE